MARNLTSIPDIQAPDADYPVGRIQNEDAPIVGTPIIEELYGDLVQFFHKLLRIAGISHNGLPENETNGFQFITALTSFVRTVTSSTSQRGSVELADNAETQAGLDSQRAVTPEGLESKTATTTRKGIIQLAENSQILLGIDSQRAVTSAGLNIRDGGLKHKIIQIGVWNMDATYSVSVAHGLSFNSIKSVKVTIINDALNEVRDFLSQNSNYDSIYWTSEYIVLSRVTGDIFDDPLYDSIVHNRGYIVIGYT